MRSPGGQYTNLKPQVESLGLGDRFLEVKENYRRVNEMLGDIVKVTPSSKMVGDLAIFMTQNGLTPENIVEKGEGLAFPDSAVSYFSGMMGQPAGGFPKDLQRVVLKGKEPITCRPGELLPPVDFEEKKREMLAFDPDPSWRAVLSYCLYPKVVEDFVKNQKEYGYIMRLGSHVFFHGLAVGETNKVNIADGKTLVIKYLGLGEVDKEGMRTVSFELNGIRRDVQVPRRGGPEEHRQGAHGGPGGQEPGGLLHPRRGQQDRRQGGRRCGEEPDPGHHRGHEDGDRHHRPDVRHGGGDPGEGGRDRQGRPAAPGHQITAAGRGPVREDRPSACRKSLFDKLLAILRTLKSSENRLIGNERHPSWVSFVAIFLPVFPNFRVYRQSAFFRQADPKNERQVKTTCRNVKKSKKRLVI